MRTKSMGINKSKSLGKDSNTNKIRSKRLLIAIPSFTGLVNSMAVDGFMRLIGNISNLKTKYEVFTTMPQRKIIVTARNEIVEQAIEQKCDWIFWIDDDMVLKPDVNIIEKLMAHDRDVIAPIFFGKEFPYIPMIFKRKLYGDKFCVYNNIMDYPKGLLKVDGIGFGCVLTKVSMFKKLTKPYFWTNDIFGEDLFFCENCTRAGIEIFVDTTLDVGHIGLPTASWESMHIAAKKANYQYIKDKNVKDDKRAKDFYANLHRNIGKKIDIVMPCYHNVDITKNAVESIIKATEDVNYKIIAVIDGYDKGLIDYFKTKKNVLTIYHKESLGFIKSTNHGLKKVRKDTDFVLLLNNDVLIKDPKWLINMVNSFDDKTGAVAPVSNFVMGVQNIAYNNLPIEHYSKFLIGFCMLIRKDVLDKVGNLDERFGMGGHDDLDLSIRIRKAGYRLKINRGVYVHHLGSKSFPLCLSEEGAITAKNPDGFKSVKDLEDGTRLMLIEKWDKETVDDLFIMSNIFILNGEEL